MDVKVKRSYAKFKCFYSNNYFQKNMELSKLNPDWQVAELHGISTYPGIINQDKSKNSSIICPCCLNAIHKDKAPLCENSKELEFLGFGFPLFYVFLKYCIILLLISITSYNGIALYWAVTESEATCLEMVSGCTSFMVEIARIQTHVSDGEVVIRICSFIIQLGVLLYIRDLICKTRSYYDERTCSLSDYSIIVENLPKRTGTRRNLLKFLQNCYEKPYNAHQITFLPDYEAFFSMEEQIIKIINDMRKLINDEDKNAEQIVELQKKLVDQQRKIHQYCNRELELEDNDECLAEKLIFSCDSEDDKEAILEKFDDISEQTLRAYFQIPENQECNIEFGEAPQPKQINWEHINYPEHKRVGRMVIGWMMTIVFLGGITAIFFFVLSEKSHLIEHSMDSESETAYNLAILLVYLALILVILFNKFVMGMVLHKICDFQLHATTAALQFHFAIKYAAGMFFTTALMTLAVEDLKFGNFYEHPYGVIEEETVMFFMNAFFVPLIWLINPWQIHVLLKRRWSYGRKDLTQKEANKIMENLQYNMGKRYAQIIEIMWFTFLYATLIPIGAFLSSIGLCLYYWIDKYNLLRRSSVNSNISGQLSLSSMKLLDITLLCKPLGEIIFDYQMRDTYCKSSVVMCGVAILYLIMPIDRVLDYFHPEKFKNEEKQYQDVQKNFKQTYQTLHPIFNLKQENQQKMFQAFRLLDSALQSTIQVVQIKSGIQQLHEQTLSPNPLKDATNILQSLFKKHDHYNFKEREKENKE